jgi:hypothetical protein
MFKIGKTAHKQLHTVISRFKDNGAIRKTKQKKRCLFSYASNNMSNSWQTFYLALKISFRLNFILLTMPITGSTRAKAVIVSDRSKTGIVGSNSTGA